jgi:predicted ATPase
MSRIVFTGGPGVGKTTLLLALQARGHTTVGDSARTIIQDRRRRGLSPRPNAYESELSTWLSQYQYGSKVFVFPPWEAIYANDAERDHTFEHVEAVHRGVQEWYRHCQYEVLEVPKVPVSERCAYVLQALERGDA